ncbi:hypothetical protein WAF17_06360 [Bernardetia sp. ABR2-2B]|uniref:hypothetical protein n=1 Tax=Bernardetia sp. ABR2-2B TaxID=3127472 RepID=UPI0030CEB831
MKKYFLALLLLFFTFSLSKAQVPKNETFKTKEDYYEHQLQVEKGLKNWFDYNPLEEDNTTLQLKLLLESYLMAWINGAPHINLIIDGKIEGEMLSDKKFEYSKELLLAMMFSKVTYLLENKEAESTDFEASLAGVKGMILTYEKIKSQTKSKKKYRTDSMEEYIKWQEGGKLVEKLERKLNKQID